MRKDTQGYSVYIYGTWYVFGIRQVLSKFGLLAFPGLSRFCPCARVPCSLKCFRVFSHSRDLIQRNEEDGTVTLQSKLQVPRLLATPIVGPVGSVG